MGEIKFRAWDKKQKKMLYYDTDVTPCITFNGVCQRPMPTADGSLYHSNISIDYTLMQSTGQKDKNGVEDWVGDIVKNKIGGITYYREIVQAESGAFCISLPTMDTSGGESLIMLITCKHENVGNIHDNPELLEENSEKTNTK